MRYWEIFLDSEFHGDLAIGQLPDLRPDPNPLEEFVQDPHRRPQVTCLKHRS